MGVREIGCEGVKWIYLAQGPEAGSWEHGNAVSGCIEDGGGSKLAKQLSASQEMAVLRGVSYDNVPRVHPSSCLSTETIRRTSIKFGSAGLANLIFVLICAISVGK
jgi:hypothetical protein